MIERLATETRYVPVVITALGGDPTSFPVALAFTSPGTDPQTGDWKAASWNTSVTLEPGDYMAQCLLGPNGGVLSLAKGDYQIYAQVSANPETPQLPVGMLRVS